MQRGGHDPGRPARRRDEAIDPETGGQVGSALGVTDDEDAPAALVERIDERTRERRPPLPRDQDVELLVQRDRGVEDQAAHTSAAVIRAVAVEVVDPRLGGQDECDLGLPDHRLAPRPVASSSSASGGAPVAGTAPVTRVSTNSPSASTAASRCESATSTARVTVS